VIQGMLYAFLGFLVSTNIFLIGAKNVSFIFTYEQIQNLVFNNSLVMILLFQLLLFLFIGAMSAYLSTKKYMK
jgi:hypothetical protein